MAINNRFVRSATYDGWAENTGHVSPRQIEIYRRLAEGGVGLIITGITYVHGSGQISPVQNALTGNDCIPGFKALANAVHDRGAKIAVQLFHGGREIAKVYRAERKQALAPSFVPDDPYFQGTYRAMTDEEIGAIIAAFGDAAARAREAGLDAVQIHGAHAYLLSQFLSPFTNRRADQWGGSLSNRLRFHRSIYRDIRAKVGQDFPVLLKIGVQDGFPRGLGFHEGKRAAESFARWGVDALEISSGLRGTGYEQSEFRTGIGRPDREGYFRQWCREIKERVDVPVMMVGGLRSPRLMEEVIRSGDADLVSLCRPLIREPGLVNEWKKNDHHRATCISCNKCFEAILEGQGLHCVQEKEKPRP